MHSQRPSWQLEPNKIQLAACCVVYSVYSDTNIRSCKSKLNLAKSANHKIHNPMQQKVLYDLRQLAFSFVSFARKYQRERSTRHKTWEKKWLCACVNVSVWHKLFGIHINMYSVDCEAEKKSPCCTSLRSYETQEKEKGKHKQEWHGRKLKKIWRWTVLDLALAARTKRLKNTRNWFLSYPKVLNSLRGCGPTESTLYICIWRGKSHKRDVMSVLYGLHKPHIDTNGRQ